MTRTRPLVLAAACAALFLATTLPADAAPRGGGGSGHGSYGHGGGHGHGGSYGYRGGYRHGGYWGWGWGLAIGVPWALGYYDPWYWGGYPRYYAYGPYPRNSCEQDEDCWRERRAREEPPAPTTQVAPSGAIAPAAVPVPVEGAPTQRPLHLNYCDESRAYYPAVATCASGWRMTAPAYR